MTAKKTKKKLTRAQRIKKLRDALKTLKVLEDRTLEEAQRAVDDLSATFIKITDLDALEEMIDELDNTRDQLSDLADRLYEIADEAVGSLDALDALEAES